MKKRLTYQNNTQKNEKIDKIALESEMQNSYIDYAMSVIVSRAIPDVRDGLKPVHRRILYAMNNLNLSPSASFKKSATIVGEVLGKYHPHGDSSVYDALVRLAQDFNMRYPLIKGQGNFGSIDGDPAAAYRYTEAKMTEVAMDIMEDLDKKTVEFTENFDASLKEPKVMPSKIPNLIVNGSSGIAVGMATNIPPHNMTEVLNAILYLLDHPEATLEEIITFIKAPDFPSGGIIMGTEGCVEAYRTGKGIITIRAKIKEEQLKRKEALIVTEIPYQVNKTKLMEQLADNIKKGKITHVSDLRDESDKSGIRIVLELSANANKQLVLNQLYKYSNLQINYGIIMLALKNGEPKILSLEELLKCWINHRIEVVTKRIKFDLNKNKQREDILEAILKAIDNIDLVISIIRNSKNRKEAENRLCEELEITKKQAVAVLEMRLEHLINIEKTKIEREYKKIKKEIISFETILSNKEKLMSFIKKEINETKKNYQDERKTEISFDNIENVDLEDLIPEQKTFISFTENGFIKRLQNIPKNKELGIDEKFIYESTTHENLLIFTNFGKVYSVKIHQIPESTKNSRGTAAINIASLSPNEKPIFIYPVNDFKNKADFLFISSKGFVKKMSLESFAIAKKSGIAFTKLDENDEIYLGKEFKEKEELLIVGQKGTTYLLKVDVLECSNRNAKGLKTISTNSKADNIIKILPFEKGKELIICTEQGSCCRISSNQYLIPSKNNKPIEIMKYLNNNDFVKFALMALKADNLKFTNEKECFVIIPIQDIDTASRYKKGSKPPNLKFNNILNIELLK